MEDLLRDSGDPSPVGDKSAKYNRAESHNKAKTKKVRTSVKVCSSGTLTLALTLLRT